MTNDFHTANIQRNSELCKDFVNKVSFYDTFLDIVINVTCFKTDIYDVMILCLINMRSFTFISSLCATEHAFVGYGAVLCMIWSSAP